MIQVKKNSRGFRAIPGVFLAISWVFPGLIFLRNFYRTKAALSDPHTSWQSDASKAAVSIVFNCFCLDSCFQLVECLPQGFLPAWSGVKSPAHKHVTDHLPQLSLQLKSFIHRQTQVASCKNQYQNAFTI